MKIWRDSRQNKIITQLRDENLPSSEKIKLKNPTYSLPGLREKLPDNPVLK